MNVLSCLAQVVKTSIALMAFVGTVAAQSKCGNGNTQASNGRAGKVKESDFQITAGGETLAATLTRAKRSADQTVILMLHGYTGSRDEFPIRGSDRSFFELAAHRLAESRIPSLRVDFRGSGDSSGRWRDTTFDGQVQDVISAISGLRSQSEFRKSRVVLLGFSQGGLVALHAAAGGADVAAVALWNPVLDPRHTYAGILGDKTIQSGAQMTFDGRGGDIVGNSGLNAEFFRQVTATNPIADASVFDGPVLVVTGARDRTVAAGPQLAAIMKETRGGRDTQVVVLDADHGFNAASGAAGVETAIACTIEFVLNL